MESNQEKVIKLVLGERKHQTEKFPDDRNLSHRRWLPILIEEVGEVAKAILENEQLDVQDELVQVAAVAVAWLEDIYYQLGEVHV